MKIWNLLLWAGGHHEGSECERKRRREDSIGDGMRFTSALEEARGGGAGPARQRMKHKERRLRSRQKQGGVRDFRGRNVRKHRELAHERIPQVVIYANRVMGFLGSGLASRGTPLKMF